MAVLQHAPAGYLLSVPLTELQITIKESCLSFLLASRKTYSGSFTLIFIHLVIDKCGALQSSLPPSPSAPFPTGAPFPPHRAPPAPRMREPLGRKTRVGVGSPRGKQRAASCRTRPELFICFISFPPTPPPCQHCSPGRPLSPGRPGQPRPHRHAGCPGGFSHSLREAQTWK